MSSKTLHDIAVEFLRESAKATLFSDGKSEFWVPKSLTGDDGFIQLEVMRDGSYTLTAPEWWLKERGLI